MRRGRFLGSWSGVKCQGSGVRCQMPGVRGQVPGVRCQMRVASYGFWVGFFFIILFSFTLNAQNHDAAYTLIQTIDIPNEFAVSDKLHQTYVLSTENEIIKYNEDGKATFRFNNNTLGDLAHIDASNPFNLLLFYQEYLNILILDRTLNQSTQLNLFDLNILQANAVSMASDNNVWVFDDYNFQLKKINRQGEIILQSDNLSLFFEKSIRPNFLLEHDQMVYLNEPEIGILVFDAFGQYDKVLDFKGLESFQILEDQLLFFQNKTLQSFHLQSLLMKKIALPNGFDTAKNVLVQKNRLYGIFEGKVEVYTW